MTASVHLLWQGNNNDDVEITSVNADGLMSHLWMDVLFIPVSVSLNGRLFPQKLDMTHEENAQDGDTEVEMFPYDLWLFCPFTCCSVWC